MQICRLTNWSQTFRWRSISWFRCWKRTGKISDLFTSNRQWVRHSDCTESAELLKWYNARKLLLLCYSFWLFENFWINLVTEKLKVVLFLKVIFSNYEAVLNQKWRKICGAIPEARQSTPLLVRSIVHTVLAPTILLRNTGFKQSSGWRVRLL